MSTRPVAALVFATALIAARGAAAQAPPPPPPPPPPPQAVPCINRSDASGSGAIRGTVVSAETGAPLPSAQVQLVGGGMCTTRTTADTRGRYEIAGLSAGRFTLTASKAGWVTFAYGQRRSFEAGRPIELVANQTLDDINVALPRGGVIVARVTDEFGEPMSGVRVQAERAQFDDGRRVLLSEVHLDAPLTDDRGEVRLYGLPAGEYYVNAMGSNPAPVPLPVGAVDRERVYLPTYFPGTNAAAGAQRVAVQAGREEVVTFPLTIGRLAALSGNVRDSSGSVPSQAQVLVTSAVPGVNFSRRLSVQPTGFFSIEGLLPGLYSLSAISRAPNSSAALEFGTLPLMITGDDVSWVTLTLHRSGTFRGRFVYDTAPPPNFSPGSLRFTFAPVSSFDISLPVNTATPAAVWQPDSTFFISGLGNRVLPRLASNTGWFIKAVRVDGRDMTDVPFDFTEGAEFSNVEVVVTQKSAQISGTVQDDKSPVGDYAALVFPENRDLWVWPSRFIATARADERGRFNVPGLPAGQYLIVALDYLEQGTEFDPVLLARLRDQATPIVLGEGETRDVTLTLIRN